MKWTHITFLIGVFSIFIGCKTETRKSYAINGFSKSLQPHLINIVSKGIVGYDTATRYIQSHATDQELTDLSQSEHPVLRTVAFREMLERPGFNHYELIMNNLGDTAWVATDAGEWGIRYSRVSDDMLQHGKWEDTIARNKTVDEVILRHNYLSSAYRKLLSIEPNEKYYSSIKEMAQRDRTYDMNGMGYEELEDALYMLAKYKKSEDIAIIKQILLSNTWYMNRRSFELMEEYPNDAYLDVYEKYYPKAFYYKLCRNDPDMFTTSSFISSLATYKNERSAKILRSILDKSPLIPCMPDSIQLKNSVINAIWRNPCESYSKMRNQANDIIKKWEENRDSSFYMRDFNINPNIYTKDTSKEPISW